MTFRFIVALPLSLLILMLPVTMLPEFFDVTNLRLGASRYCVEMFRAI
mgnify:CR=1 FL=1